MIYWRELRSIFTTIVAYVVIAATLLANGGVFCVLLWALLQPQGIENMNPMEFFLGGNVFFYLILLPGPPLVTMRAFSEEWRSGTLETMLTAPVTDLQLVLAKYLAYLSFFVFMWLPTLIYR